MFKYLTLKSHIIQLKNSVRLLGAEAKLKEERKTKSQSAAGKPITVTQTKHKKTKAHAAQSKQPKANQLDNQQEKCQPTAPARINQVGIQMINEKLRHYLFNENVEPDPEKIKIAMTHLTSFELNCKPSAVQKDVDELELPTLRGQNIAEHFTNIGRSQARGYLKLMSKLTNDQLPPMPTKFEFQSGWTRLSIISCVF
jgi:DNA polymerase gamma 1